MWQIYVILININTSCWSLRSLQCDREYILQKFVVENQKIDILLKGPPNNLFFENALKKLLNIFSNFYLKVQSFRLIMKNNFIQVAML